MSYTGTQPRPLTLHYLREALANNVAWQQWLGVDQEPDPVTPARDRVYIDQQPDPAAGVEDPAALIAGRPNIVIRHERYQHVRTAKPSSWARAGTISAVFLDNTPAETGNDPPSIWFYLADRVDQVVVELLDQAIVPGYLDFNRVTYEGLYRALKEEIPQQGDYIWQPLEFEFGPTS